jgi:hypothetical protein
MNGYSAMSAGRFYETFNAAVNDLGIVPRVKDGYPGYRGMELE